MQLIGLTGGIATGKTTASAYLQQQNIPVIDADLLSRQALEPGTSGYQKACRLFPQAVDKGGLLNRGKLGDIIFNDVAARKKLEGIIHPEVQSAIVKTIIWYWFRGYCRVVLDIPLLFETRMDRWMSYTVVITVSGELQIGRLIERSHLTLEQAESRIAAQMPINTKCKLADVVIQNDGDIGALYKLLDVAVVRRWMGNKQILFLSNPPRITPPTTQHCCNIVHKSTLLNYFCFFVSLGTVFFPFPALIMTNAMSVEMPVTPRTNNVSGTATA
ncbi:Dephospho-CoA kinase domain-containing protein-like [Paramicrosporidium saccamoebae]|uniref:Dephospho-CoA kinase domain-containing protein-like n=1 Tax=Paramicrosporidium saccamoebae TaxID=1246581 RepID=A0A2H9TPJ1_9FUNG|nr:Dephospho-CoA kinase domain-containing protein-like [Paramicrosporidium saccamoebae]